jgi:O-antigen/teichoic acid export membrane protein
VPGATDGTGTASGTAGRARAGASENITRMGRGGSLNLVGALCYQLALFAVLTLLARDGQVEVGRYTTCYALLSLLGLLSLAGFRAAMTRFVAMDLADGDTGRLRGTLRLGLGLTTLFSVVVGGLLALLAPAVAAIMDDPALVAGVRIVALTLPAACVADAALSASQGWRTQRPFALIGRIGEPIGRFALTAVAVALGTGYQGALWAGAATAWLAALAACWWLLRRTGRELRAAGRARPAYRVKEIFSFSMVSWVSALAATGLIWAGTLLLGVLASQEEVGTYSVATRLVTLAVFVMAPINATFTPHMAHLFHTGQRSEASRAYGSATRWILTLSAPAFVMLVVLPEQLLSYFGEAYVAAATVTVVLAVGQLVSAAAGPCGTVLNMSGRVGLNMADNLAVLVLAVVLNLVLIPEHGVLGAAIAWSSSLVAVNIAKLAQASLVVGVRPVGAGWGRVLLACVPTVLVALVVGALTDSWVPAVLLGGPVVLATYFGAVALIGVPADDRAVLAGLVRGRRRGRRGGPPSDGAVPMTTDSERQSL